MRYNLIVYGYDYNVDMIIYDLKMEEVEYYIKELRLLDEEFYSVVPSRQYT